MIKMLLADDEGIVLQSLQHIIEKNFGTSCEVKTAKTGREVIRLAEEFRPDIAMMDIQMPGINGIEAIEEIKTFCPKTCFIIMSAYDTFDYAKKAMSLGVMDFITKPANAMRIVQVLEKAIGEVKRRQEHWEKNLEYKEKLEAVIPIIESGMIYSILFQDNYSGDTERFRELLDIPQKYGFILVIEVGDAIENRKMTNVVGMSVKAQKFYDEFRQIVKQFFSATVGPMMANKVVVFVPVETPKQEYKERVLTIERADHMIQKLMTRIELFFRVGIGSVHLLDNIYPSYQEACLALKKADGPVMHINDFAAVQSVEENYPLDTENAMYLALRKGDVGKMLGEANQFFLWMENNYGAYIEDIRLKILELVMYAERIAFHEGGTSYHFRDRANYLTELMAIDRFDGLKQWFLEHMKMAGEAIHAKASEKYSDIVAKARNYMEDNFRKDISLDDVSRVANVSPYYFSKVFKDETGETFVEYLTKLRIAYAKKLLREKEKSIKQICLESGCSDPNYFSRIFKKSVGVTPSEFQKEGME